MLDMYTFYCTTGVLPYHLVKRWHNLPHTRAMVQATREPGGAAGSYSRAIEESNGYTVCPVDSTVAVGDVLIVKGPVVYGQQGADLDTVLFVNEACEQLVRSVMGLVPVDSHNGILKHYRPKLKDNPWKWWD